MTESVFPFPSALAALEAAGESTRLRLLAQRQHRPPDAQLPVRDPDPRPAERDQRPDQQRDEDDVAEPRAQPGVAHVHLCAEQHSECDGRQIPPPRHGQPLVERGGAGRRRPGGRVVILHERRG